MASSYRRNRGPILLTISAALASALIAFIALLAAADVAPTIAISDARCWRSIVQTDDLLCIGAYNLPQQTTAIPTPVATPEAWCYYLTDQTGCITGTGTSTGGAVSPTAPTSLQFGSLSAWVTVCDLSGLQDGCTGATTNANGTLYSQDKAPRIWYGLAGHYFSVGHGITWGDASFNMCVEPTSDFASTSTPQCTPLSWNSEANTQAAQRAQLSSDLIDMLVTLEANRNLPKGSYIQNAKITAGGRVLVLEAYPYTDQIIPATFQAAAIQAILTPYTTAAAGVVLLQTQVAGTAQADPYNAAAAGNESFGVSGGFFTTVIFMFMGAICAYFVRGFFRDSPAVNVLMVITFLSVSMVGVWIGGPSLSAIAVTLVVLSIPAGWFVLSRLPTG